MKSRSSVAAQLVSFRALQLVLAVALSFCSSGVGVRFSTNCLLAGTTESQDRGAEIVKKYVLEKYQHVIGSEDQAARDFPQLLEVEVNEIYKLRDCDGWLTSIWAPIRRHPPYYSGNHQNEYWGVTADGQTFRVGQGYYFAIDQEVEVSGLWRFLSQSCKSGPGMERAAETFFRVVFAGRFALSAGERGELRRWKIVKQSSDLPDLVRSDGTGVLNSLFIPPQESGEAGGRTYKLSVLAQVAQGHIDLSSWAFDYDSLGRLLRAKLLSRRQIGSRLPSDYEVPPDKK